MGFALILIGSHGSFFFVYNVASLSLRILSHAIRNCCSL